VVAALSAVALIRGHGAPRPPAV